MGAANSIEPQLKRFLDLYDAGEDITTNAEYKQVYKAVWNNLEACVKDRRFSADFEHQGYNLFAVLAMFHRLDLATDLVSSYSDPIHAVYQTHHQRPARPKRSIPERDNRTNEDNVKQLDITEKKNDTQLEIWGEVRAFLVELLMELKDLPKPMELTCVPYLEVSIELGLHELASAIVRNKRLVDSYRVTYTMRDIVGFIAEAEENQEQFTAVVGAFFPKTDDVTMLLNQYTEFFIILSEYTFSLEYCHFIYEKVQALNQMKDFLCLMVDSFPKGEAFQDGLCEILGVFLDRIESEDNPELTEFTRELLSPQKSPERIIEEPEEKIQYVVKETENGLMVTKGDPKGPQPMQPEEGGCLVS